MLLNDKVVVFQKLCTGLDIMPLSHVSFAHDFSEMKHAVDTQLILKSTFSALPYMDMERP
jgi:hypothetical protein